MADIIIGYETLFDILRKEKSRSELQQLPSDFYGQVVGFVRKKKEEVEAAGGLGSVAAQKPLIQYRNVQKILRELYERRERKIIEMAINRARTESNIVDTAALLSEEQSLYQDASALLSSAKSALLEPVLIDTAPEGVVVPVMAENEQRSIGDATPAAQIARTEESISPDAVALRESCVVTFLAAVPKFLGLKGEIHGPYEPGERAELPGKIAAVLLRKKRVEII